MVGLGGTLLAHPPLTQCLPIAVFQLLRSLIAPLSSATSCSSQYIGPVPAAHALFSVFTHPCLDEEGQQRDPAVRSELQ
jgi:hypothetical protein